MSGVEESCDPSVGTTTPKPWCCAPDCGADAELMIDDETEDCGCDPYMRRTYACEEHVGLLLGHEKDHIGGRWVVNEMPKQVSE